MNIFHCCDANTGKDPNFWAKVVRGLQCDAGEVSEAEEMLLGPEFPEEVLLLDIEQFLLETGGRIVEPNPLNNPIFLEQLRKMARKWEQETGETSPILKEGGIESLTPDQLLAEARMIITRDEINFHGGVSALRRRDAALAGNDDFEKEKWLLLMDMIPIQGLRNWVGMEAAIDWTAAVYKDYFGKVQRHIYPNCPENIAPSACCWSEKFGPFTVLTDAQENYDTVFHQFRKDVVRHICTFINAEQPLDCRLLPKFSTDIIDAWLRAHESQALPSLSDLQDIADFSGLADRQILDYILLHHLRNPPKRHRQQEEDRHGKRAHTTH